MDRTIWRRCSCIIAMLFFANALAAEQDATPDMEFLEFLAEGRQIDGEYHDPLQMQNWSENEVADTMQEDKGHE